MKKETARTLMVVVGVLILLAVLGLGSAVWLFTQSIEVTTADDASATERFDEIRERFDGITPLLEIRDREAILTRRPPEQGTGTRLTSLRIVHWDADDDTFARIDLPFWLLRLKSGPIEIASNSVRMRQRDLRLTVEELEQYGPTLVLDHEERGDRVLIWTE
ncbi:MAG: hypothetical protein ACRD26_21045 [Vicinamibacterales bacterium]